MKAVQLPSPADTSDLNSARSLAVLSVPPHSRVLCVKRGDSETVRLLGQRGCHVATVEVGRQSASFVPPPYASVIAGDVETAGTKLRLDIETFDAILLLDVLGYLPDPSAALAWARERLSAGGRLIASFGNVAHGAVRLSLLRGVFPYTDTGLLDRARVRFYDQRSAEALLLDAGLRIDERLRVTRGFEETEIPTNTSIWPPDIVAKLLHDREATTYEFVFVASHGVPGMPAADVSVAERLQSRVEELEAARHATDVGAARLRAEVDARMSAARALEEQASQDRQRARELEAELNRRMEELHVRQHDLRQLQADIADREAFIAQLRAQASSDRATLEALGAELQQVRALLDTERTEAQHARAEVAALSARIVERRGDDEQRAPSMQQLATEWESARATQANLTARLAAEHDRLVTASSERDSARAAQVDLAATLAAEHAQLVTASSERESARAAQVDLAATLAAADAQLVAASSERESARAAQADLTPRLAAAHAQIVTASSERESARAAHADLTARLAAEHAQMVTASSELERVRAELLALRAYARSAGFRLVNGVSLSLRRHERVYAALRSIVRKIAP